MSNGALNDIRQYDTRNRTWMQVTVDGTLAKMPDGRYFHAAELTKQSIYIYGGLSSQFEVLGDFWVFNIHEHRWTEIIGSDKPDALAGHTLTAVKDGENEVLILIGGYRNGTDPESIASTWEFSIDKKLWTRLNITGSGPITIFGHSAMYHSWSQVLYVFGGYQIKDGRATMSRSLYTLRKMNGLWTWHVLPVFNELNRPEENLPRARFLHSSVGFQNYM